MKRTSFLAAASVAVATAFLAPSCEKQNPTHIRAVTLTPSYTMVESRSMVTKAHSDIVDAIAALNPAAIPVSAREGNKTPIEFSTGQPVTLPFGSYQFSASYISREALWLNDYVKASSEPFIAVSKTATISEGTEVLELPATYECIALVVPSAQVGTVQVSLGGWKTLPLAQSGDYSIVFISGDLASSNPIMLNPSSDAYLPRQVFLPKTSENKGRYYFVELPLSGTELPASLVFSDWTEGDF